MKRMIYVSASLVIVFILSQLIMSYSLNKIENPSYIVLKDFGDFEVRLYDSMIMANTPLSNNTYEQNANEGFRRVASYIFGQNEREEKIAMTSPVFMEMGNSPSMSFVMPKQYNRQDLPDPTVRDVELVTVKPMRLAVISFSGYANDEKIAAYRKKLMGLMIKNGIKPGNQHYFLGYNAPWQVIGRKNEVAIEIKEETNN
ncbi:MAG TPA: soul heme-binding protein [Crocinitomicaceae bacterium]|nr:heme-binding protein [Flavobacteriales bacterium]HBW85221.1 soul heme-binding protein [Crocinitomicaceae bacterium]